MEDSLRAAIEQGLTCDITTYGRRSGQPRRIEIWYFVVEGAVYISGTPGPRDWYANLLSDPRMIFHVKHGALADLAARGVAIQESAERRQVMAAIQAQNSWFRAQGHSLEAWVVGSPLVRVEFEPSGTQAEPPSVGG